MSDVELPVSDPFTAAAAATPQEALIIEVDGFEGPLDLLLALARTQKVDLAKISILQLADQYLLFMESALKHRLELAADYLVMAAWLAYLKSRLILPQAPGEEGSPSAEDAAAQLRWRLQRLELMREAGVRLVARERLDRDVFARGAPEPVRVIRTKKQIDTMYDLLIAYSQQRIKRSGAKTYQMVRPQVYMIEEARERLSRTLGKLPEWSVLTRFLPLEWRIGDRRRSALASTFSACLEFARDGKLQLRQMTPFGDIFVKDSAISAGEESR
jgi:segregation and condensation protein A